MATTTLPEYQARREVSTLDRFRQEMARAFPDAKRRAFDESLKDPRASAEYDAGYNEGRREGLSAAVRAFQQRITYSLDILLSVVDPATLPYIIGGSIATYLQPDGTPPPAALRKKMEAALWFKHLKQYAEILDAFDPGKMLDLLAITFREVVDAMVEAGPQWVAGFFALTGRPREQGRYAGRMIGRACGEIIVAVIEDVIEVPLAAPPEDAPREVAP